jgi:hypothetical protein
MKIDNNTINNSNISLTKEMNLSDTNVYGSQTDHYVAIKEHLCCELNGTSVILSLGSGKYYGINSVGSFIWSIIQNPKTFEEIQDLVLDEFEVEEEICRQEVLLFLKKMEEQNLVEVSNV